MAQPGCIPKGGNAQATASVTVVNNVSVGFDRDVDQLPFNPRADRLVAAMSQLQEVLGHPITFRFDTALLPEYRSSFEYDLIEAVEHAARDLGALRDRSMEVFTRAAPLLTRIECHYAAGASDDDAKFDAAKGTLSVSIHPHAGALLPRGLLFGALEEEYDRYLESRYGNMASRGVPAGEQAEYFHFLTGYRRYGPRRADLAKPEGYVEDPRALEIQKVLDLAPYVRADKLKKDVERWLVDQGDYFTSAYVHHPELVERAPSTGSFHRVEANWVAWLSRTLPSLDDAGRLKVAKTVFVRGFNRDADRYGRFMPFAFPGFDPLAFAIAVVDEWRSAGYVVETPERRDRGALFEFILCPSPVDKRGSRSYAPRCEHDLYEYALATPRGKARLVELVLKRRDPYLTETVFANLAVHAPVESTIEVWRAVEGDEATWRVATHVIADEIAEVSGDRLLDESRRLYRDYPRRRGILLYLLAQVDRYDNGKVPWPSIPATFGGAIGQHDFEAFLDEGYRSLSLAPLLWPAMSQGWSRATPVASRLDRFMEDPMVRNYNFQDPWRALRSIVNRVCSEKRLDDLAVLHARFEDRARKTPSEARPWENLIEDTRPKACR
jgi:hypothetical protein